MFKLKHYLPVVLTLKTMISELGESFWARQRKRRRTLTSNSSSNSNEHRRSSGGTVADVVDVHREFYDIPEKEDMVALRAARRDRAQRRASLAKGSKSAGPSRRRGSSSASYISGTVSARRRSSTPASADSLLWISADQQKGYPSPGSNKKRGVRPHTCIKDEIVLHDLPTTGHV